ncbi:hypothetical protein THOD03_150033 [Vibrio harveyi]|nr:hypothetical protein THOD03_150033 [Vibrio harveyi]
MNNLFAESSLVGSGLMTKESY